MRQRTGVEFQISAFRNDLACTKIRAIIFFKLIFLIKLVNPKYKGHNLRYFL